MRSFIAFLACTGFIVWAHSCEKRIVGVKIYGHKPGVIQKENELSYSSVEQPHEHPLLLANVQTPVALDALFVNVRYGPASELDWKK
ncbi:hypothetical protein SAMN05428949_3676 [Chitinophaga sp. YR627]|nr:hypothetical protein SAMN05428949_3676 [Chitinophaga sp. YR627]